MQKLIFIASLVSVVSLVMLPAFVFAQPSNLSLPNPLGTQSFEELLTAIINWILTITLPIVILLILYAGFQFMISGVSPDAKKNAANVAKFALIGYAIMLLARILIGVITGLFGQ